MSSDFPPKEDNYLVLEEPLADTEEDLWEEIDRALEQDLSSDDESVGFNMLDSAYDDMKQTLVSAMAANLNPVQRYMKALAVGEESTEIFEISEMIISALIPKLEEVGLKEHMEDLVFFRSLLLLTLGERDQHALEKLKEILLEAFGQIETRFGLKFRGYRTAVRNLVEFYRAMKSEATLSSDDHRRFFAIGIPSLTWVRKTKVAELASLSGISAEKLSEIKKLSALYQSLPSSAQALSSGLRIDRAPKKSTREKKEDLTEALGDIFPSPL